MGVGSRQRFTRARRCPVCGGCPADPPGQGRRCAGYLSDDGERAYCAREDLAGPLPAKPTSPPTYEHRLSGPCSCGQAHGNNLRPLDRVPKAGVPAPRSREACTTRYAVRGLDGRVAAIHVREDGPDGKRLWWEQPDRTRGLGGRRLDSLPLYGVHELPTDRREAIIVCEGEKARDVLHRHGIAAVGTVTGADSVPSDDTLRPLLGRPVRLWPDHDEPGRRHMTRLAERLRRLGHADVRIIDWQSAPAKGDAADFFTMGGTPEQARELILRAAKTETLAEATATMGPAPGNPWSAALDAPAFLASDDGDVEFLEARVLVPGAVTAFFAPRGLGKSLYALWLAVKLARAGTRVLYVDRDNPKRVVRERLRAFGGEAASSLKMLARDHAPPLTDRAGWQQFPVRDFDVVVLDSFDSAAEGVGEQSSDKVSLALASILDLAHRDSGPAVLVLGNTVRTGSHSRGSGVIEDRFDIVFEVRDATRFTPTGTRPWVEELPPADAGSWAARATRRQHQDKYRLAFVASKFRVGEEPEPFIVEIDLTAQPWQVRDVTDEVDQAGAIERKKREAEHQVRVAHATEQLAVTIETAATTGAPLLKGQGEQILMGQGLRRDAARKLLESHAGRRWEIVDMPGKGHPKALLPVRAPGMNLDGRENSPGPETPLRRGLPEADFGRRQLERPAEIAARNSASGQASHDWLISAAGQADARFEAVLGRHGAADTPMDQADL